MSVLRDSDIGGSTLAELKTALDQLTRERDEALGQQAATAEVLKVISRSAVDLPAVLDTLLASASILAEADIGTIRYQDGAAYRLAATYGCAPEWREHFARYSMKPDRGSVFGQTILKGGTVHIPDVLADPDYARPDAQKLMNLRAALGVPLVRDGQVFGVVNLFRTAPRPFTSKQIALVETFADQAVIAIENARLFEAEQQRSAELAEALEQQTATSEVLRVISSSPGELKPVFETVLANAVRICDAKFGSLYRYDNGTFVPVALFDAPAALAEFVWKRGSFVPPLGSNLDRLLQTKDVVRIADESAGSAPGASARFAGARSLIAVPMLKDNVLIGAISIYRREVQPFTNKQVELVQHFAAQAVIAIENVRLFEAEQQRTAELSESLEQQTATAEVLGVISSSPGDLKPVFNAMLENAMRICDAKFGIVFKFENGAFSAAASRGVPPAFAEFCREPRVWAPDTGMGRLAGDKQTVHIHDLRAGSAYEKKDPGRIAAADIGGARTAVIVPMVKDGTLVGVFSIYRQEVRPFTHKQIELVTNFAAQAVIAIENTRLLSELRESLSQQTATADVLKVISRETFDLQAVLNTLVESAATLCEAYDCIIYLRQGDKLHVKALHGPIGTGQTEYEITRGWVAGRTFVDRTTIHVHDLSTSEEFSEGREMALRRGHRTILSVPLLRGNEAIGVISIRRFEVKPFTDKQIELLKTFADQAVIAIENVRLFEAEQQRTAELSESLEQQTATSNVLDVISRSAFDLHAVFETVVETSVRLCAAHRAIIYRFDGELLRLASAFNATQVFEDWIAQHPIPPGRNTAAARAALERRMVHIPDVLADPEYTFAGASIENVRTVLGVPILKGDELLGAMVIYHLEVRPFTDKQIALVETFADQAAIAIENVRLFEAEQQRTSELRESLDRHTATADILKVIASSPTDVQPVFDAIAQSAMRLFGAQSATVTRVVGDEIHLAALTVGSEEGVKAVQSSFPSPLSSPRIHSRVAVTGAPAFRTDIETEPGIPDGVKELARARGYRSLLVVPMLRDGAAIGTIGVTRSEPGAFTDSQIDLLRTFADQAVIAIENVRLFDDVQKRTEELTESLAQQTATSEVLQVISSSPGELAPVFDSMLANATHICEASLGVLLLSEGDAFRTAAVQGSLPAEFMDKWRSGALVRRDPDLPAHRAAVTRQPVQIADLRTIPAYRAGHPFTVSAADVAGIRTMVTVPMIKDNEAIGVIAIYRQEIRPFTDKQVELVTNFAAQAVIAIENTRLLSELRESLAQQTATADVLKVIASSSGELQQVFDTMLAKATQLCEASYGNMWVREGDNFRSVALHGPLPAEYIEKARTIRGGPNTAMMRVAQTRQPVQVHDTRESRAYLDRDPLAVASAEVAGIRTLVSVPMVKDDELVGVITIYRKEVRPFTDKQVELVANFAAQAVIAIENTRLLSELRQRTDDLTESLEQQTATSEVLKVISSSPGELEPVFQVMLENATHLCEAHFGAIVRFDGELFHPIAELNTPPRLSEFLRERGSFTPQPGSVLEQVIQTKAVVQIEDDAARPTPGAPAKFGGARSTLGVPMVKDDKLVGAFVIYRTEVRPFTDKQMELVSNFAAQAVIAIENTRLLSELRESLERQTATSEVLRVISSSPGDLGPVFNAMLENATHICEAKLGHLFLLEGPIFRAVAIHSVETHADLRDNPALDVRDNPGTPIESLFKTKQVVHVPDLRIDQSYIGRNARIVALVESGGARTFVTVPMLKEGGLIGAISMYRQEVRPFTEKQIELVTNFAAQAVIAIENTRLLNELRESLAQQTATADVLKVISRSTFDLQTVLDTLSESVARLCEAYDAALFLRQGDRLHVKAHYGPIHVDFADWAIDPGWVTGRAFLDRAPVQVDDLSTSEEFPDGRDMALRLGHRTMLAVPLLRENESIGAIALRRFEVKPFTEKQIELVKTFADQAVIAIENARLFEEVQARTAELSESLEQQTATSEVLKVISSSPGELEPVFHAMLENATRICEAKFGTMFRFDGKLFHWAAGVATPPALLELQMRRGPYLPDPGTLLDRMLHTCAVAHTDDYATELNPGNAAKLGGARSTLAVPMLKDGELAGGIIIYRQEVRPFTEKQIELVQNFAAQAVIAIENTRLLSELRESLAQQTATSEVLEVISSSPGELGPVFEAMLENATRICEAELGTLFLREPAGFRAMAIRGNSHYTESYRRQPLVEMRDHPGTPLARLTRDKTLIHIPDLRLEQTYLDGDPVIVSLVETAGARTHLVVPMLKDEELVGAIVIYRQEVRPFGDKQIELVQNFAAQAVIAIENTRLLNELRQRTDDLSESLEQQTATSDVLRVISGSPGDLKPVFDAMLESATRICAAEFGFFWFAEGEGFRAVATHGVPPALVEERNRQGVVEFSAESPFGRMKIAKQSIHVPDIRKDPAYLNGFKPLVNLADMGGARTLLLVPMLKEKELVGAVAIYRKEVLPFTVKQIELVQNFAAQAVIAIENTRLLNELRQRTDDLTESLEQQTATSEVLKVISSSAGELQPVFEAMLENATRLCGAKFGNLYLSEGDAFRTTAMYNVPPAFAEARRREPLVRPTPFGALGRVMTTKLVEHIPDVAAEEGYINRDPMFVTAVELGGFRSLIGVPMLKDGELIGIIVIYRQEVGEFSAKQIELVENFAAQAVIAIENARLLSELRESLEQQTATSEVLEVIASSAGEIAPVFGSILENATRICDATFGNLLMKEGKNFRRVALHNAPPAMAEDYERHPIIEPGRAPMVDRMAASPSVLHVVDVDAEYPNDPMAKYGGARSLVSVPMLKDEKLIGLIGIYRQVVQPFSEKQVALLQNFAAQAVIAIENTRLLNELRQRTDDLTESLEQQTATSEVLKVISSSPGELELVFQAMLENAVRICRAQFGVMHRFTGEAFDAVATLNIPPALSEFLRKRGLAKAVPGSDMDNLYKSKQVVHTIDMLTAATPAPPAKLAGARTQLAVPMLKDDELIGAIVIYRTEVQPFSDKQIELVANFSAQAVIAVENARLLNELRQRTDDLSESLEQQTASGEILASISGSMADTKPVFDAIVRNLRRLFGTRFAVVQLLRDGIISMPVADGDPGFEKLMENYPRPLDDATAGGVTMLTKQVHQCAPVVGNPDAPPGAERFAREFKFDSYIFAPMIRDNRVIGAIGVARAEPKLFTDKQVALIKGFADQAVIAIENTRLFDEVQTRTADLQESLEYQTATSEILTVISRSPTDANPVFDVIGERAEKLCDADVSVVSMVDGDLIRLASIHGVSSEEAEVVRSVFPLGLDRETITSRTVRSAVVVHVADVLADPTYDTKGAARAAGYRGCLGVPMIRDGQVIGTIFVGRKTPGLYTDSQVQLLKTFADQAVIAIGNVRLFEEVQERTEDLAESLQQQTATADVLKIISRSAFDLKTVLDTLLRSAARLCEADQGTITQRVGDKFYRSVAFGYPQAFMDYVKDIPIEMNRNTGTGRALLESKVVHIPDVEADPEYKWADAQKLGGYRAMLGVPMLREGEPIGVLTLTRREVRPFTEKEIELVTTFADQAAIAIENVRLFDEIQEKSHQLEEASKHKSQFLANMSHELRTPLNAILGYTELIADGVYGETPEKVQTTIQRIITNGKHLLGLINDVLDLSKIEAGQLTLSLADYSMKDVVHAVYGAVEPLAAGKKLDFKVEIAPDMPAGHGDERRLTQVLLNLVGNAIKFTDEGSVTIKAALKDGMFSVAVVDTGPGISEADKPKLFQEFQQADSSTTKKKGGTGLGLAISKRIIEMHGGSVSLESRVGEGSTFSFSVPVHAEQTKKTT